MSWCKSYFRPGEHGTGEKEATARFQSSKRDGGLTIRDWKMTERTEGISLREVVTLADALKKLSADAELEIGMII
jgi:hypothetical protein